MPPAASIATSTTTPNIWARRSVSISNNTQNEADIKNSYTTTTTINPRQNQADEPFVVYNYMESLPSFTNLKLDPTSAKDQSLEEDLPKLCLQQQQQQHENKIAIKEEETEGNNKVSSPSPQNVSVNKNQLEEDNTDDVDSRYVQYNTIHIEYFTLKSFRILLKDITVLNSLIISFLNSSDNLLHHHHQRHQRYQQLHHQLLVVLHPYHQILIKTIKSITISRKKLAKLNHHKRY